jgi:predicted RNase H-like HicB family nuclease
MELVIALLETPNFRFEAVGATEAEAMELLEAAWSHHFDEMGQPANMLSFDSVLEAAEQPDAKYFISTRTLALGAAYRDAQVMPVTRTAQAS